MISSPHGNNSLLQLKKEELKIEKDKSERRKTNINAYKRPSLINDIISKRISRSKTKYKNNKNKRFSLTEYKIKKEPNKEKEKKKEKFEKKLKYKTSKELLRRKMMINKNSSNKKNIYDFKTMSDPEKNL